MNKKELELVKKKLIVSHEEMKGLFADIKAGVNGIYDDIQIIKGDTKEIISKLDSIEKRI